jgi:recombination protein RecA
MSKSGSGLLGVLESVKNDKKIKVNEDTIVTGNEQVEYVSTGSIIIDKLLGYDDHIGGVGKGRIVEIFGLESSGKTTLALSLCKEVQKRGGNVCFVDFEAALDKSYAERAVGLDTSPDRFAWLRPENMEEGCNIVDLLLDKYEESKVDVIVMDSIKAMIPKTVMDGLMGDEPPMALQARRIGQWLGKVIKRLKDTNTVLVLLNQMTKNIKSSPFDSGGEFETPGGLAVRFYASQRIQLKLVTKETKKGINPITNEEEDIPTSNKVRATVVKNKIGTPYRKAEFYVNYGGGIDNKRSVVEMAVNHGIIQRSGAWYSYKQDQGGFRVQGEESMREYIFSAERRGLLKEIADKLIFKQDEQVKEEAKQLEQMENKATNKLKKASKKASSESSDSSETEIA